MKIKLLLFSLLTTVSFSTLATFAAPAKTAIPPDLEAWQQWVLKDYYLCYANPDGSGAGVCQWPGTLSLDVTETGATFSQHWNILAPGWAYLPGGIYWPQDVLLSNAPATVVKHNDRPALWLEPGHHTLSGTFQWKKNPQTLHIPTEVALLNFSRNGQKAETVWGRDSSLWISEQKPAKKENERVHVEVYRLIRDASPILVETVISLELSNVARELSLGNVLLDGYLIQQVESALPVHIAKNGDVKVLARPGKYELKIILRGLAQTEQFTMPKNGAPWPESEVWAFAQDAKIRVVNVVGEHPVDPKHLNVPQAWQTYPAFELVPNETLTLETQSKAGASQDPGHFALARKMWLNFSGTEFTCVDTLKLEDSTKDRLNMRQHQTLGNVHEQADNYIISKDPITSLTGIELRKTIGAFEATSQFSAPLKNISAAGWDLEMDRISTSLILPPGYELLAATGVDTVNGSWKSRWNLLDIFLLCLLAAISFRLFGFVWGLIAVLGFTISLQLPHFPAFGWLNALISIALLRALPNNWMKEAARFYNIISLGFIALIIIPFTIDRVKLVLYPQLERSISWASSSQTETQVEAAAQEEYDLDSPAPRSRVKRADKYYDAYSSGPSWSIGSSKSKSRPVVTQAGPGRPNWIWKVNKLYWSGPIPPDQTYSLYILRPWQTKVVYSLSVAFGLAFIILLIVKSIPLLKAATPPPIKKAVNVIAWLTASMAFTLSAQADTPTPELLTELKSHLIQTNDCKGSCVEIEKARIEIEGERVVLRMKAHAVAPVRLPLPGNRKDWAPSEILINDKAMLFGKYDSDQQFSIPLNPGLSDIQLIGSTKDKDKVLLQFPKRPHWVETNVKGWDVFGLSQNRLSGDALEFQRTKILSKEFGKEMDITPFVTVTRTFDFDIDWHVETTVKRIAPQAHSFSVHIPLLETESPLTENLKVDRKRRVALSFAQDQQKASWVSTLTKAPDLVLKAPELKNRTERWRINASPLWHMTYDGIAPLTRNTKGHLSPYFAPWPGETLSLHLTKPDSVPGNTLAIDQASITSQVGERSRTHQLKIKLRATQGGRHTITLAGANQLLSVTSNGGTLPLTLKDNKLNLPISPGEQNVVIEWREKIDLTTKLSSPLVDLNIPSANVEITIELPPSRWLWLLKGPKLGPALLFWSILFVLVLFTLLFTRYIPTPLRAVDWIILGLGIALTSWLLLLFFFFTFAAISLRAKHVSAISDKSFNFIQFCLIGSVVVCGIILIGIIPNSLLGEPNMYIDGNNSYAGHLNWFTDFSEQILPVVQIFSLPQIVYQIAILLWSIWLAMSLMKWGKWIFESISKEKLWIAPEYKQPKKPLFQKDAK